MKMIANLIATGLFSESTWEAIGEVAILILIPILICFIAFFIYFVIKTLYEEFR